MQLYPFTIPEFARYLFPSLTWRFDNLSKKEIFITFDDGPDPEVTPWVLSELQKHNAKASFFVVGENAKQHQEVMHQICEEGHSVGNHTFNHVSGYASSTEAYLENVKLCQELTKTNLFRPPYGRIKRGQIAALKSQYQIVMWNQLSGDFDVKLDRKRSLESLCENAKEGNIIVFHDSQKSFDNLKALLPPFLAYLSKEGFICSAIPCHEPLDS